MLHTTVWLWEGFFLKIFARLEAGPFFCFLSNVSCYEAMLTVFLNRYGSAWLISEPLSVTYAIVNLNQDLQ